MFLPPVGEGDLAQCLKRCFEIMNDYNSRWADISHSRIEYVSDELLALLQPLGLVATPMGGDYVYDMRRMIDLAGGDLKSKRHLRNRFQREYEPRTEPLKAHHVPLCLALLRQWQEEADARSPQENGQQVARLRNFEVMATQAALQHAEAIGLTGMVLWAGERLAGFTLGQPLSSRQASIVIEKTDHGLTGAAQYIFSEFCRQFWMDYPECNVGDDWGVATLRWTKLSYRPIRLLSKYVLTPVPTPLVGWTPEVILPTVNPQHVTTGDPPDPWLLLKKPEIGDAGEGDLEALVVLERRAFGEGEAFHRRQLRYLLRSPRARIKVARIEGRVAGWAIVLLRKHRHYESARLYSLAVDPDYQGRGVGELLVSHMLNSLREMGIRRCFLEVREDNLPARRLYERLGFVSVATLPNYYGQGRHGTRMLKIIDAEMEMKAVEPTSLGVL